MGMFRTPTGPSDPASRAEPLADFLGMRRAELGIVHDGAGLGFAQLVIAAQQDQQRLAVGYHHQAFHLRALGQAREGGHFGDGLAAGCVELLGPQVAGGIGGGRAAGTETAFSRLAE